MPYLISILAASLILFGFLLLTLIEERRGSRFFAGARYKLDAKVSRAFFVIEHVDWGAFMSHVTRTTLRTVAHDVAHGTLLVVRAVERFLTRAVRALRMHREGILPHREDGSSRIAGTVTYLKQNIGRNRKSRSMSDIVPRDTTE
ncbi:MAG TPA: hypothetical protein VF696_01485 [Candidatus Paceibacterota bacterium]|jgi:hypothetical protein